MSWWGEGDGWGGRGQGKRGGKGSRRGDGKGWDSKRARSEEKCKQCRNWCAVSEMQQHGKWWYCDKCCAKWEVSSGNLADGEAVGELTEYKTHWRALVDEEWAEEQRIVNERLQWPLRRLEAEGLAVANVWARKNGTFFGDPIVKFSRGDGQLLPRHSFQSGDELIVSRESPFEPTAWKCEVLSGGARDIAAVVKGDLPWEAKSCSWRLDRGANKTAYDRTCAALGYVTGHKYRGSVAVRSVLLEAASATAEEPVPVPVPVGGLLLAGVTPSQAAAVQAVGSRAVGLVQVTAALGTVLTMATSAIDSVS